MNKIIEIKEVLSEWKIEEFYILLDKYLKEIKREEYKYLLINLFELCMLEKDNDFKILFEELEELGSNDYDICISTYLKEFYWYISINKGKEAEIYFKILSKYLDNMIVIEELSNILKRERVRLLLLDIVKQINNTKEVIHVLENVSNNKKELIYKLLNTKEFECLKVCSIGNILLFRLVNLRQNINYDEEVNNIINLYENSEYELCIGRSNILLKDSNFDIEKLMNSREFFIVLAKAYYKLNMKKHITVRKYLNIANYLNKYKFKYEEKYDYTSWIEELSISISNHKKIQRKRKKRTKL